ncbi:N-acetyltransferase [Sesbania bispinosa]|nr:N-acetyltransferase [Sesbania bispinosa]
MPSPAMKNGACKGSASTLQQGRFRVKHDATGYSGGVAVFRCNAMPGHLAVVGLSITQWLRMK